MCVAKSHTKHMLWFTLTQCDQAGARRPAWRRLTDLAFLPVPRHNAEDALVLLRPFTDKVVRRSPNLCSKTVNEDLHNVDIIVKLRAQFYE